MAKKPNQSTSLINQSAQRIVLDAHTPPAAPAVVQQDQQEEKKDLVTTEHQEPSLLITEEQVLCTGVLVAVKFSDLIKEDGQVDVDELFSQITELPETIIPKEDVLLNKESLTKLVLRYTQQATHSNFDLDKTGFIIADPLVNSELFAINFVRRMQGFKDTCFYPGFV